MPKKIVYKGKSNTFVNEKTDFLWVYLKTLRTVQVTFRVNFKEKKDNSRQQNLHILEVMSDNSTDSKPSKIKKTSYIHHKLDLGTADSLLEKRKRLEAYFA